MHIIRTASLFLVACAAAQTPVTFVTSARPESAIDTIGRTLAAEGQTPAKVDRQLDVVQTEWKDTGFGYGFVQGANATVVRRYTVTIAPSAAGATVTARIDAKRCARGAFTIAGGDVQGTCEEATAIPGSMQTDLDALGAKLRTALSAPNSATSPAPSAS